MEALQAALDAWRGEYNTDRYLPNKEPPIGAQTAWTIRLVMAIHKGRSAPLRVSSLTGALSLSRFLRFGLAYFRWLDVHPAGRAGQRLGDLAVG
jgi:hypothetical protein